MLATLEQRLVHAEERALALSMGHLCANAGEEVRLALEEANSICDDLAHITGPQVRELKRRAENVLVELFCLQQKSAPSLVA